MKKRLFTAMVAMLLLSVGCNKGEDTLIDPTAITFASPEFEEALLQSGADSNGDGVINRAEAKAVTEINLSGKSEISSLSDLRYFINIEVLNCSGTSVATLDVTSYPTLVKVDASSCPELTQLKYDVATLAAENVLVDDRSVLVEINSKPDSGDDDDVLPLPPPTPTPTPDTEVGTEDFGNGGGVSDK